MGRKTMPGLYRRDGTWHIDKQIAGFGRLCKSCKTRDYNEAKRIVIREVERIDRQLTAKALGLRIRPQRLWREAATKYLEENLHKASIEDDARFLAQMDAFIGDVSLDEVDMQSLEPFIAYCKQRGNKTKTVNIKLALVRRILNLAARRWRENRLSWIGEAPLIELLTVRDALKPYPLDWDEQEQLFKRLPGHLTRMALFKVNTGNRETEVCGLRWEWEVEIPEFEAKAFLIPGDVPLIPGEATQVKNREDRIVVCNRIASSVIEACRGEHSTFVFTYQGKPLKRMHNSAWNRAWKQVGLPTTGYLKGVHNLKHTFGRRLRAAGIAKETRRILLGHKAPKSDVTDHYSVAELEELRQAVERLCVATQRQSPALTMVKRRVFAG